MLIFGFGKITKKIIGKAFQYTCSYCKNVELWDLCILRTWFTLFFIPIIPYGKKFCIMCPNCGNYVEITEEEFQNILSSEDSGSDIINNINLRNDEDKYYGKTETQINYLREMEEYNKKIRK